MLVKSIKNDIIYYYCDLRSGNSWDSWIVLSDSISDFSSCGWCAGALDETMTLHSAFHVYKKLYSRARSNANNNILVKQQIMNTFLGLPNQSIRIYAIATVRNEKLMILRSDFIESESAILAMMFNETILITSASYICQHL